MHRLPEGADAYDVCIHAIELHVQSESESRLWMVSMDGFAMHSQKPESITMLARTA